MAKKPAVPLSENVRKQHYSWTAEQCLAELRRVAQLDLARVISRNYFRNHSAISESTWNCHFGTFAEFKRLAGVVLSRQQHHLEKQIARAASVDHYREFNKERAAWGSTYRRKNKTRFQTIIACSDLHDKECDPFYLDVLIDTIKRVQPDHVVIIGDLFDLPEFSRYGVDPRQWDPVGRIKAAHTILRRMREAAPDAEITLIEGNHEFRLMRHLCDATPALRTVLSDLHGMTVAKLLGLDAYEVNYVAKADLAAYTNTNIKQEVAKNYKVFFDAWLAHHFPEGRGMGVPGANGHHHNYVVWSMYNEQFGAYHWTQLSSGHVKDASYTNGEKWDNGFEIEHIDTHKRLVNQEYVMITDMAIVGGRYYYRKGAG